MCRCDGQVRGAYAHKKDAGHKYIVYVMTAAAAGLKGMSSSPE